MSCSAQINYSHYLKLTIILCLLSLLGWFSGCEQNRYTRAELLYQQRRFASSVEALDGYIKSGKNGALVTRAELTRSNSYYELGMLAKNRKNWQLAIRLFKLANSEVADNDLADVYMTIANNAIADNNISSAMQYLTNIIVEVPLSEHVPEALQKRIQFYLDVFSDRASAWRDYMNLYDSYPDNQFEILARPYVRRFIGINIGEAVAKAAAGENDAALGELFQILRYPICDINQVNLEISNIYQTQAEQFILDQNYLEADRYFRMAIQYYPSKKEGIDKRLREVAILYIGKGDSYLDQRDFQNALLYYRKTFEIIPDYDVAIASINKLRTVQENIRKASNLANEAENYASSKRYADAQRLFTEANQLDRQDYYLQKINEMANLLEAEKNPLAFAQRIIGEYKGGILSKRISAQKAELLKLFKADEVRDSGWKMLLSTGQYKYEARYDIITPNDSFFYVWQVNLRDRNITPLNKLSERFMQ